MTNEELSLKTKQSLAQVLKNTMEHKKLSKSPSANCVLFAG